MKRLIAILLSIILLCMIVGCHGSSKKTEDAAITNKTKETSDNLGQINSSSLSSTEIDNSQDVKATPDGEVKIAGYRIYEEEDGYVYFDVLILNDTNRVINNVGIDINILDDDENIVDSIYPSESLRVLPQQIISLEGLTPKGTGTKIAAEKYTFLDDGTEVFEDYFDDVKSVSLMEAKTIYYIEPKEMEKSAIKGTLEMPEGTDDIIISEMKAIESSDRFAEFSFKLLNNTTETISELGANIELLDKNGNIVGTIYPNESTRIQPNQSITLTGTVDMAKYDKVYFTMDGYCYISEGDDVINGYLKEIPQAIEIADDAEEKVNTNSKDQVKQEPEDALSPNDNTWIDKDDSYLSGINVKEYVSLPDNYEKVYADIIEEVSPDKKLEDFEKLEVNSLAEIIINNLVNNCTYKKDFPDSLKKYLEIYIDAEFKKSAAEQGMDLDTFIKKENNGEDVDYEKIISANVIHWLKAVSASQALIEQEGIELSEKDISANKETVYKVVGDKLGGDINNRLIEEIAKDNTTYRLACKWIYERLSTYLRETSSADSISAVKKYHDIACELKVSDLTKVKFMSGYDYLYNDDEHMSLVPEDVSWIENPMNTNGSVEDGALYRKIAYVLTGIDMGIADYRYFANYIIGFVPDTREEFDEYTKELGDFIVMDNRLECVMKKFESLDSVSGTFDFKYNDSGEFDARHSKFTFEIADLSKCAEELHVSEEMLGYILAMLEEFGPTVSFDGNSYAYESLTY